MEQSSKKIWAVIEKTYVIEAAIKLLLKKIQNKN